MGAAQGKGYVSEYENAQFWEYDPSTDSWFQLNDLLFRTRVNTWIEYEGLYYYPAIDAFYVFDPFTKNVDLVFYAEFFFSPEVVVSQGEYLYWYYTNRTDFAIYNIAENTIEIRSFPDDETIRDSLERQKYSR